MFAPHNALFLKNRWSKCEALPLSHIINYNILPTTTFFLNKKIYSFKKIKLLKHLVIYSPVYSFFKMDVNLKPDFNLPAKLPK